MNKKQVYFTILLTVAAFAVWLCGELLIGFVFNLGGTASAVWAVIVVTATLALNIYKCCFKGGENKNSRKW